MATPPQLLLGTHVSIAGGIEKAFARGEEIGCTAIQIFTRNASRWQAKPLADKAIAAFRRAYADSSINYVSSHDSYLINLASPDPALRERSLVTFLDEMERCHQLGITDLVMHPGAHVGSGRETGLTTIVDSFRHILQQAPSGVRILLENTAGQGTCLGARFEDLAEILAPLPEEHFAVCFDTCHAFAAGYDLSSVDGYFQMMNEFDRLIGCDKIALFHLNDSKKECASRVDRHEHIGQGFIGQAGFQALMQDARFAALPKVIELPPGEGHCHDRENLGLLRSFAGAD